MAHPDDLLGREVVEQRRLGDREVGLPELGVVVRLDRAAEIPGHELHAVTDPERRDPQLEDRRVELGGAVDVDRGRPTRQHQRERVPRLHLGRRQPMADELGEDTRLAHPARDQLAVLASEIEDEDGALLGPSLRLRRGEREDVRQLSHDGSSGRPW